MQKKQHKLKGFSPAWPKVRMKPEHLTSLYLSSLKKTQTILFVIFSVIFHFMIQ